MPCCSTQSVKHEACNHANSWLPVHLNTVMFTTFSHFQVAAGEYSSAAAV